MNERRYDVKVRWEHKPTVVDMKKVQTAVKGKLRGEVYSPSLDMNKWGSAPLDMVVDERVWVFQLDNPDDFDAFAGALRTIPDVRDVEKFRGLSGVWPQNASTEREKRHREEAKEREQEEILAAAKAHRAE